MFKKIYKTINGFQRAKGWFLSGSIKTFYEVLFARIAVKFYPWDIGLPEGARSFLCHERPSSFQEPTR
jgi:hypothetical protein